MAWNPDFSVQTEQSRRLQANPAWRLAQSLPKSELHIHIEGTLEPEMIFQLARKNAVTLPYANVSDLREAYAFTDLQSFLNVYYAGASVLLHSQDFFDMAWAYLERAAADRVTRAEIFFDPQTHTARGISMSTVVGGLHRACVAAKAALGVDAQLILCFLRHLSEEAALETLEQAAPHLGQFMGVGLDSSELGHPPEKFARVFAAAKAKGLRLVAHAGEEGPPEYVWQALELLHVERIDHGVQSLRDATLVAELVRRRMPLTVCPLSNIKLKVFADLAKHNLPHMLQAGLLATVNSDDPAYFGGYLGQNFASSIDALGLSEAQVLQLVKNSWQASFLSDAAKREVLANL